MLFYKHPGLKGIVYAPPASRLPGGKHPCPDCFNCQSCGNDRCALCRAEETAMDESNSIMQKASRGKIDFPDIQQKP